MAVQAKCLPKRANRLVVFSSAVTHQTQRVETPRPSLLLHGYLCSLGSPVQVNIGGWRQRERAGQFVRGPCQTGRPLLEMLRQPGRNLPETLDIADMHPQE